MTGLNFLLIVLLLTLSYYTLFAVPVLFLLASNLFDILGYHFTLIRRTTEMPEREIIKAYRINQLMFDLMLFVVLGLTFGWIPALAGVILKFFGLQDILYYIFLQKQLPEKWHWLRWTPFGLLRKTLTKKQVVIQALIGVIISFITIILFLYL